MKAAFLYNFARFVAWPSEAFAGPDDPIVVGVAGEDPFGDRLERAVEGRTAQGRSLIVRRFSRPEALDACHILFVGAGEDEQSWLEAVDGGKGVFALTVGEGPRFARRGAVAFVVDGRRIRLLVNLDAVEDARLRLSARLLAVATVEGGPLPPREER